VLDKLEAARDALAHVFPDGNLADVIEHALDLILAESRRKRALVEKPRKASKPLREGSSRHVPAEVARTVWKRSEGQCECTLPDGRRCDATRPLELDHIRPFALGGRATVENLRVACRDCNQLAARRAFGDQLVGRYARRRDRSRGPAASGGTGRSGPAAPPPVAGALALFT
jgi:5-methylcytosine-specific restriction endonuclease McrA